MAPQVVRAVLVRCLLAAAAVAALFPACPIAARAADSAQLREALELRDSGLETPAWRRLEELLARDPGDVDLARLTAETAAWAGRLRRASHLYGRLAARGDSLSLTGLAMVHAWQDRLRLSASEYAALLARPGLRAPALLGLARVRHWQGRPGEARRLLEQARALGPVGRQGDRLGREIDLELEPRAFTAGRYQSDTEGNTYAMTLAGAAGWLDPAVHVELGAGAGATSGAGRTYHLVRYLDLSVNARPSAALTFGGAWSMELARAQFATSLTSSPPGDSAAPRLIEEPSEATWSACARAEGGGWQLTASGGHEFLDETPALIDARVTLSHAGLDGAWAPCPWVKGEAGGSLAGYSDHNSRAGYYLAARARVADLRPVPAVAFIHRAFSDSDPRAGRAYFDPDHYRSDELELSVEGSLWRRRVHFFGRAALGTQRVTRDAAAPGPLDTTRGLKLDLEGRPADRLTLAVSLEHSNSAVQTASGYALDRMSFRAAFAF